MAYDIFISYRRRGAGAGVAGELQSKFENLGYKVFLDVDEIGSGQFPMQIKQAISECKDFLLVLAPGTLDRCTEEDDWVRREIILAQEMDKNIIGVGLPGFVMPESETLPEPLQSLTTRQVFLWTHEYRSASFAKIEENLISTMLKKKKNRQKKLFLLLAVGLLAAAIVLLFAKRSGESSADSSVAQVSDVQMLDSQLFDYHAIKAIGLTQNLPDTLAFKNAFLQLVADKEPFERLMQGIAECDTALMLKKQSGNLIVDNYEVETMRDNLLALRKGYFSVVMADLKMLFDEDGVMFAKQDMEIAKVLALPAEEPRLDSLDAIIELKLKE